LFIIAKEGLSKNTRKEYHEKTQTINRFIIGGLIINDVILNAIRRELRKLANGVRIDLPEIEDIVRNEVLKREIVEGDDAKIAQSRINRFYKKANKKPPKKKVVEIPSVTKQTS